MSVGGEGRSDAERVEPPSAERLPATDLDVGGRDRPAGWVPMVASLVQPGLVQLARLVERGELWLTLAFSLLWLFPNRYSFMSLALVFPLWICRWIARGRLFLPAPTDVPVAFLLLWLPVNLWASADWTLTRVALLQLAAGILLFLATYHWATTMHRLRLLAAFLSLIAIGMAIVAPMTVQWGGSKIFALPVLYEVFSQRLPETINPNVLAGALVMLLPLPLALVTAKGALGNSIRQRVWFAGPLLLAIALGGLTLMLTQSRGAYAALLGAVACLLGLRGRRARMLLLILGLVGLALFLYWGPDRLADTLSTSQTLGSWQGRREVWSRSLYAIVDFPFTGIGLGTFSRVIPLLYPYFILGRPDVVIPHAHNLFLQVAVDLGLPGLVTYLSLLMLSVFMAWRSYLWARARREPVAAALALGLLGSYAAMGAHGLVDAVSWGSKVAVVPWLLMGMTVALYRLLHQDDRLRQNRSLPGQAL